VGLNAISPTNPKNYVRLNAFSPTTAQIYVGLNAFSPSNHKIYVGLNAFSPTGQIHLYLFKRFSGYQKIKVEDFLVLSDII